MKVKTNIQAGRRRRGRGADDAPGHARHEHAAGHA